MSKTDIYGLMPLRLILIAMGMFYMLYACGDRTKHADKHAAEGKAHLHEANDKSSHAGDCDHFHDGANKQGHHDHDDHDGQDDPHDHGNNHEKSKGAAHFDHVSLSDEAMKLAEIRIETVRLGRIQNTIELMGEVGLNEDRACHIVPRFPGIVRRVLKRTGDPVKEGETLAIVESNESLARYQLKSLMSGTVIFKHISLGEFVTEESTVYRIADLSDVWVNLAVYPRDVGNILIGQNVRIEVVGSEIHSSGKISYISSIYNKQTRHLTARVVISNKDGRFPPGTFVKGAILLQGGEKKALIAADAVQIVDDKAVVFIPEGRNEFKALPVLLGKRDSRFVELRSGLKVGDRYVSGGAFELKAKLVTSTLDSHAGHGH